MFAHRMPLALALVLAAAAVSRADDAERLKLRLTALSKLLETGAVQDRIRAAGELAKIGGDAKPAARALARACVDTSPKVSQAALEAMEKVFPELYEAAVLLLKDTEEQFNKSPKRAGACNAIAKMGDDAEAGIPILLQHLRMHLDRDEDFFELNTALVANVEALKQLAPENTTFHKYLKIGGSPANPKGRNRALAIQTMGELGEAKSKLRREFMPVLKQAYTALPTNDRNRDLHRIAAIDAIARFGKDAKTEIPTLKKLKLDGNEAVRKAAADAVERIESEK